MKPIVLRKTILLHARPPDRQFGKPRVGGQGRLLRSLMPQRYGGTLEITRGLRGEVQPMLMSA
jgi:hypothetical protein